jgi:hypothetical protein
MCAWYEGVGAPRRLSRGSRNGSAVVAAVTDGGTGKKFPGPWGPQPVGLGSDRVTKKEIASEKN